MPFTLTRDHREAFDRDGVLRLAAFYSQADIAPMAARLWDDLERRFGAHRDRLETWSPVRPGQFQAVERAGAFAAMDSEDLRDLANGFLGEGAWAPPRRWGQPLVTFPSPVWDLSRVMWHLDYPAADYSRRLPAIRLFVMLEPVRPGGGGTLYVAGSHQVAMDIAREQGRLIASAKMRERLKAEDPWFARLWATPGDDVRALMGERPRVRGFDLRIEEMIGEPGDIFVMHPTMLHGLSHNTLDRPRMMLVQSLSKTPAAG